tara:strand:- start:309 stop:584 length:276 start_codon:yes stop_codon:yes gene_type:complete
MSREKGKLTEKRWKVLREEKAMEECTTFNWQDNTWTSIDTQEGEVWDMNLYRDDITDVCHLVFYPTFINDKGEREVDTSGYKAKTYKVEES